MKTSSPNQIVHYAKCLFAQYKWALAVLLFATFASVQAQQITGTIVGTVKDQTGAVVNTATVTATNVDTGFTRSVKANGYGEYRIDYLPVGKYSVAAAATSFKRFVQQNLDLSVDQTLTLEITLTVGAQSETVTVDTAPPSINTSDAVLGRTIEADEIIGLPLVNRNVYAELSLTPGIMANSTSPTTNPSGTPNFTVGLPSADVQINGSLDSGNGNVAFYLDGGNNITGMRNYGNPAPNPDALEEFRVETNAFSAQYGQFSGAVVTVLTKSGTNKFHGALFEFNRNTDFNAFSWNPGQKPHYRDTGEEPLPPQQFWRSLRRPHQARQVLLLLQLCRSAPGTRSNGLRRHDAHSCRAPGRLYRGHVQGLTCRAPRPRWNGTNTSPNCQVATLNCMPSSLLDPTAANFLNINNKIGVSVPLPTGALVPSSGGGAYLGVYVTPTDSDEYLAKYDENIGDADHVTVTYFFVKTTSTPSGGGNINWTGNQSAAAQTNANVGDVHTFSPSTANQAWLTFTRAMGGRALIPVTGPANQTLASFGSNFLIQGPAGLPYLNVGAGFNTGNPNAGPVTGSDNYELRDWSASPRANTIFPLAASSLSTRPCSLPI